MPMPTYGSIKPLIRTVAANTTAPTGNTFALAKAEAHGWSDSSDGRVAMSIDANKAVTARYYDRFLNKWQKIGSTAAKHTVSWIADSTDVWEFPKNALIHFTLDATTANISLSAKAST